MSSRGPFIPVPDEVPGIRGLMMFKPESGAKLLELAEQLLRGPSPLTTGERELIATVVSSRNDCYFCEHSHAAAAAHLGVVATEPASDKMRALLRIAEKVQQSGLAVQPADVDAARAAGATDEELHDAVLVAAAFCMFNRYVDGLAAITPRDDAVYDAMGARLATQGYAPPAGD